MINSKDERETMMAALNFKMCPFDAFAISLND